MKSFIRIYFVSKIFYFMYFTEANKKFSLQNVLDLKDRSDHFLHNSFNTDQLDENFRV